MGDTFLLKGERAFVSSKRDPAALENKRYGTRHAEDEIN